MDINDFNRVMPDDFFDGFREHYRQCNMKARQEISENVLDALTDTLADIDMGKERPGIHLIRDNLMGMLEAMMQEGLAGGDVLLEAKSRKRGHAFRYGYHFWFWMQGDVLETRLDRISSEEELQKHRRIAGHDDKDRIRNVHLDKEEADTAVLKRMAQLDSTEGNEVPIPPTLTDEDLDKAYEGLRQIKIQSIEKFYKEVSHVARQIVIAEVTTHVGESTLKDNAPDNIWELVARNREIAEKLLAMAMRRLGARYVYMMTSYATKPSRIWPKMGFCDLWMYVNDIGEFDVLAVHHTSIKKFAWRRKVKRMPISPIEKTSDTLAAQKFFELMDMALDDENIRLSLWDYIRAAFDVLKMRANFLVYEVKGDKSLVIKA